jgi:hypothetical protein
MVGLGRHFKEHDIDLSVGQMAVTPGAETKLRGLLDRALDLGKGWCAAENRLRPFYLASETPPALGRTL